MKKEHLNIVVDYDKWSLYPMLLKCYHHNLHPITKFEVGCAKQTFDEDFNFDIF